MSDKKHGLGRGLDALFGEEPQELDVNKLVNETVGSGIETIDIEKIKPCPYQPRKNFDKESLNDLTQSIKEKGILQPLLVRKKENMYEIVAGERRYRAALNAGLKAVPVIEKNLNDSEAFEVSLIENIIRENLNPIEEANGFDKLVKEYHYTHDTLSKSIGKSRSYISNALRLLNLPKNVQNLVGDGKLSAGHARTLVGLQNAEDLAQKIIVKDLNVRQTEDLILKLKQGKKPKKEKFKPADLQKIEEDLARRYAVKTEVSYNPKGKGKIVLKYNSFSELENLLNKLER
ncbi:MAG: ParB/RepB/Spo0J family partition protein [Alphaproteobacteria bacterium]|nr:ParB/RepB/Spo0J family partition protein [Alphaproteobacteria bacterium]